MFQLSEVNNMAFDIFYEYETLKHGITIDHIMMKDIMAHAKCPECDSNDLIFGEHNDAKVINEELYFYAKTCRCNKCGCLFNFRTTQVLTRPDEKYILFFKTIIGMLIGILTLLIVLICVTPYRLAFICIFILLAIFGSAGAYYIYDNKPSILADLEDKDLEKEEILRSDFDYEET